jgi:hypothetical protein
MYCAFHGEYTLLRRVVPNFIAVDCSRGLPGYRVRVRGFGVLKSRTAMASCSLGLVAQRFSASPETRPARASGELQRRDAAFQDYQGW